jgi:hypothetical protein
MTATAAGGRWWLRWSLWLRPRQAPELDPSRADLVVVASSFDDAEAASAALARAEAADPPWRPADQAVLRHHLLLPAEQVGDAVAVAGQDGYIEAAAPAPPGPRASQPPAARVEVTDARMVVLVRVQVLDALRCSQERSRMAGLAQRREGVALGWDALQPPA